MQRKEVTRLHNKANTHSTDLLDLRPGERVWIQHHQTKEWYNQAIIVESRHSGRANELVDDNGKTYYRGRRFLRLVQHLQGEATVFRCYTNRTEETADPAMEPIKPTYSAILSRDKPEHKPKKTDVNVNVWIHRPLSAPIDTSDGHQERTT